MHWPAHGDRKVFRRTMMARAASLVVAIGTLSAITALAIPVVAGVALSFGVALATLAVIWSHARAQDSARRVEIVKSFATLTVLFDGQAIRLDRRPLLGEFGTRREAAHAAMAAGCWAVIVHAYEHFYVLTGTRTRDVRTPVSFRTRAVSDIVPAISLGA